MPINIKAVFIDTFSQWLTFFSSNDFLWCCFLFNGKFLRLLTSFEPGSERSSAPNPQSGRLTSPFYFNQFLVDKTTPFLFHFPFSFILRRPLFFPFFIFFFGLHSFALHGLALLQTFNLTLQSMKPKGVVLEAVSWLSFVYYLFLFHFKEFITPRLIALLKTTFLGFLSRV